MRVQNAVTDNNNLMRSPLLVSSWRQIRDEVLSGYFHPTPSSFLLWSYPRPRGSGHPRRLTRPSTCATANPTAPRNTWRSNAQHCTWLFATRILEPPSSSGTSLDQLGPAAFEESQRSDDSHDTTGLNTYLEVGIPRPDSPPTRIPRLAVPSLPAPRSAPDRTSIPLMDRTWSWSGLIAEPDTGHMATEARSTSPI